MTEFVFYFEVSCSELFRGDGGPFEIKKNTRDIGKKYENGVLEQLINEKIEKQLEVKIQEVIPEVNILGIYHILISFGDYFQFLAIHFEYRGQDHRLTLKDKIKDILALINEVLFPTRIRTITRFLTDFFITDDIIEAFNNTFKNLKLFTEIADSNPFILKLHDVNIEQIAGKINKAVFNYIACKFHEVLNLLNIKIGDFFVRATFIIANIRKIDRSDIINSIFKNIRYELWCKIGEIYYYLSESFNKFNDFISKTALNYHNLRNASLIAIQNYYSIIYENLKVQKGKITPVLFLEEFDDVGFKTLIYKSPNIILFNDSNPLYDVYRGRYRLFFNRASEILEAYMNLIENLGRNLENLKVIINNRSIEEENNLISGKDETKVMENNNLEDIPDINFIDALKEELKRKMHTFITPMKRGGGWADIYFIFSESEKELRVVKVYREYLGVTNRNLILRDAEKLSKISHKNIVKAYDKGFFEFKSHEYFYIIEEYIDGKNFDEIDQKIFFERDYRERLTLFLQLLDGVSAYRKEFETHNDLFPRNIMISKNKITIIDPGSSKYRYDPEHEDTDLYAIKEGLINCFFKAEELEFLNSKSVIRELNFRELRQLVINEQKFELDKSINNNDQGDKIEIFYDKLNGVLNFVNENRMFYLNSPNVSLGRTVLERKEQLISFIKDLEKRHLSLFKEFDCKVEYPTYNSITILGKYIIGTEGIIKQDETGTHYIVNSEGIQQIKDELFKKLLSIK